MQTWPTMNRLMSRLSVHVRRTLSKAVPALLTSLTQHPSHSCIGGISSNLEVKLNGSRHLISLQLLHSKQSIVCPAAMHSITEYDEGTSSRMLINRTNPCMCQTICCSIFNLFHVLNQ